MENKRSDIESLNLYLFHVQAGLLKYSISRALAKQPEPFGLVIGFDYDSRSFRITENLGL